jgi:hypothetical protein
MRALALVSAAAAAALVLAPTVSSSDAQPGVRTVDRVFSCALVARGDGTFDLDLAVAPRKKEEYASGSVVIPAHVLVSSGVSSLDGDLVAVRAGAFTGVSRVQPAGAYVHSRKCRPARAAVALSPRGLPYEGAVWGAGVECRAPKRVLVRVKATFSTDTPWRKVDASYTGGRSPVIDGTVAVRTETKSALIAFMTVKKGSKASIRYTGRCA